MDARIKLFFIDKGHLYHKARWAGHSPAQSLAVAVTKTQLVAFVPLYAVALGDASQKVSLLSFSTKKSEIWNFHNIFQKIKKGRISFHEAHDSYASNNTILFQVIHKSCRCKQLPIERILKYPCNKYHG